MRTHYLENYLAQAQHKITIDLIGAGGTGSHVLSNLAMISKSMVGLGRQPLFVRVYDPDIVEPHNIGRQMFSPADVGRGKATVMTERINRFYGLDWHSYEQRYGYIHPPQRRPTYSNITISCVDSVKSRKEIGAILNPKKLYHSGQSYETGFYWMDIGNDKSSGQVILGTVRKIGQPGTQTRAHLPTFLKEFPKAKDIKGQPSCSMAESLASQDLFVNKLLASYATHMLWDLLRDYMITYRMIYMNLDSMKVSRVAL